MVKVWELAFNDRFYKCNKLNQMPWYFSVVKSNFKTERVLYKLHNNFVCISSVKSWKVSSAIEYWAFKN